MPSATTPIDNLFTASIAGVSYDGKFSIAITGNAGNVTQNNQTTEVIVKDEIAFGGSLVLYSIIGTDVDSILMGWAYCSGNKLISLFLEVTDGVSGFTNSTVTGSCNITNEPTTVNLVTHAECLTVARPSAVPTIDGGNQLALQNGSVGSVTLDRDEFNLIPFATVDCSNCSASSILGGWFEVHSVMTGKTSADVCLGIFYLSLVCSAEVSLQYMQCLAGNATSQTFNAGYDLSSVIKSPALAANTTCKASPSTSSDTSSPTQSSAGPKFKIPFLALPIALVVGLVVIYS